jgi:hypothetical protein
MASKRSIDDNPIEEAKRLGRHKTKKAAVTAALSEYIRYRKQLEILELAGTIDFDPEYDYKKVRLLDRIEAAEG